MVFPRVPSSGPSPLEAPRRGHARPRPRAGAELRLAAAHVGLQLRQVLLRAEVPASVEASERGVGRLGMERIQVSVAGVIPRFWRGKHP